MLIVSFYCHQNAMLMSHHRYQASRSSILGCQEHSTRLMMTFKSIVFESYCIVRGYKVDTLNRISNHIHQLHTGEQWTLSVQDLLISRTDFQSISVFLSREANKGHFSLLEGQATSYIGHTSLTIIKH